MIKKIVVALLVLALAALVVGGIFKAYEHWRDSVRAEGVTDGKHQVQQLWDADKIARDKATLEAVAGARKQEQENAAAVVAGERHAREEAESRARRDRAAAGRSAAAAGGLSGHIADLNAAARALNLSDAAACPGELVRQRDAAVRARELLGSCGARYRDLGQGVDDAWRAVALKLDTALGYVHAVAPAQ